MKALAKRVRLNSLPSLYTHPETRPIASRSVPQVQQKMPQRRRGKAAGKNNHEHATMKMMTEDDIRTELGWTNSMIHSLLHTPDSTNVRRNKHTGGYISGHYCRDRVLAVAQSKEGQAAKRRWDETLRSGTPNPGWTTRLGDIGRTLGITAVAAGRMLERLGYRCGKHVTDKAVAAGCGVHRWDGYTMHDDWHLERVVAAIRSAAQVPGKVADALAAAVASHQARERLAARKRRREDAEINRRQEEEAVIVGLETELRALRVTDLAMSLLAAVEYITPDPARRIALYRYCHAEDQSVGDVKDLAFLERRARAEGFQV
jgi:hypothetical protein